MNPPGDEEFRQIYRDLIEIETTGCWARGRPDWVNEVGRLLSTDSASIAIDYGWKKLAKYLVKSAGWEESRPSCQAGQEKRHVCPHQVCEILTDRRADTWAHGQLIYDCIYRDLAAGRAVLLNFAEIIHFAPSFWHAAIGQLLFNFTYHDLLRRVQLIGIEGHGVLLALVLMSAAGVLGIPQNELFDPNYRPAKTAPATVDDNC